MRKLATIRRIDALRPITDADAIECAVIGGWTTVVKKDEFKEGDEWRQTKKPNKIPKEYYDLGGEADGQNIEGLLHGPDNVPGPAYIDPGNLASSPSMAGDVDSFTFEATYQKNVDDGNGWKNRIPLR